MPRILVSGLINVETTLKVDGFPLDYFPVRYAFNGVRSTVSGVGYNVAHALTVLGHEVRFLSMIGDDAAGRVVRDALQRDGLPVAGVLPLLLETPQSVILVEPSGRREIHVDLKRIQESQYPLPDFEAALGSCQLACLCNINFSRPMLQLAKQRGIPIATDIHAIAELDSDYDRDFMAAASILFQSHERLPCSPEAWIKKLWQAYGTELAVVGLGAEGALLGLREGRRIERCPAVVTRPIVNTIGAGDALFSAFVDGIARGRDPVSALRRAVVFASWKIGASGGAEGLLSGQELDAIASQGAG